MKRSFLIVVLTAVSMYGQIPYTFDSGTVAKAREVNANLMFLYEKIDSLGKRVATLEQERLPIGAVVAVMVKMDTSTGIWVLADGRTSTTEYFQATGKANVPDLRGQFLRGMNEGRSDGRQDPEGSGREAGSYQADTLKSHSHLENLASGNGGIHSGGSYGVINQVQTGKTGGAETRPRNMTVYWYVKVKP
jgi:hypothetical protein